MLGKRLLAAALVLLLLLSLTPAGALAFDEEEFLLDENAAGESVDTPTDDFESGSDSSSQDDAALSGGSDSQEEGSADLSDASQSGDDQEDDDEGEADGVPEDGGEGEADGAPEDGGEGEDNGSQEEVDEGEDNGSQEEDDEWLLDFSSPYDGDVSVRFSFPQYASPDGLSVWDSLGNLMSPSADGEDGASLYLLSPGPYSCLYHDPDGMYEDYETAFELRAGQKEATVELYLQSFDYTDLLSLVYVNPLYEDVVTEEEIVSFAEEVTESAGFHSEQVFAFRSVVADPYETAEDAAAEIRRQFCLHESSITVSLYHEFGASQDENISIWKALCRELYNLAIVHTGDPKQGDYMKYEYGGYDSDGAIDSARGVFQFTYVPKYFSSAEQEAELDGIVADILAQLDLDGKNPYHKICAIYDYICSTVTYDNANLNNDDYKLKYTAYAALRNGCALCQGFSTAFYRLCLESGVDARVISSKQMDHAWNIVQVGDVYYELDSTWDRQKTPENYTYFLRGRSYWVSSHKLNGVSTIGDQFSDAAFASLYPLPSADFVPPVSSVSKVNLSSTPLRLQFGLSLADMHAADAGASIVFFKDGMAFYSLPLSSGQVSDGVTFFTLPLMFDELPDTVTIKLFWGDGFPAGLRGTNGADCTADGYSVTPSAGLASSSAAALSLLDLSYAASNYFRSTGLGLSQQLAAVSDADLRPYAVRTVGLRPAGCDGSDVSVLLEGSVCLRVYFRLGSGKAVSDFSFTLDGSPVLPAACEGGCFIDVQGLSASGLSSEHCFSISDGTDSFSVYASALSYADAAVRRGAGAVQDLGKALYRYAS